MAGSGKSLSCLGKIAVGAVLLLCVPLLLSVPPWFASGYFAGAYSLEVAATWGGGSIASAFVLLLIMEVST